MSGICKSKIQAEKGYSRIDKTYLDRLYSNLCGSDGFYGYTERYMKNTINERAASVIQKNVGDKKCVKYNVSGYSESSTSEYLQKPSAISLKRIKEYLTAYTNLSGLEIYYLYALYYVISNCTDKTNYILLDSFRPALQIRIILQQMMGDAGDFAINNTLRNTYYSNYDVASIVFTPIINWSFSFEIQCNLLDRFCYFLMSFKTHYAVQNNITVPYSLFKQYISQIKDKNIDEIIRDITENDVQSNVVKDFITQINKAVDTEFESEIASRCSTIIFYKSSDEQVNNVICKGAGGETELKESYSQMKRNLNITENTFVERVLDKCAVFSTFLPVSRYIEYFCRQKEVNPDFMMDTVFMDAPLQQVLILLNDSYGERGIEQFLTTEQRDIVSTFSASSYTTKPGFLYVENNNDNFTFHMYRFHLFSYRSTDTDVKIPLYVVISNMKFTVSNNSNINDIILYENPIFILLKQNVEKTADAETLEMVNFMYKSVTGENVAITEPGRRDMGGSSRKTRRRLRRQSNKRNKHKRPKRGTNKRKNTRKI